MTRQLRFSLAIAWVVAAAALAAARTEGGEVFRITIDPGELVLTDFDAALGMDGDFLVVWSESDDEVWAQRFDRRARPETDPLQVAAGGGADLLRPAATAGSGRGFLVGWVEAKTLAFDLHLRRFAGQEPTLRRDVVAATLPFLSPPYPALASVGDGSFVALDNPSPTSGGSQPGSLSGQLVDRDGKIFRRFPVDGGPGLGQAVAADAGGRFTAVWTAADLQLFGRRFDAAGDAKGPRFQISDGLRVLGTPSASANQKGRMIVGWTSNEGVDARFYHPNGRALGRPVLVDPYGSEMSVAMLPSGESLAVWVHGALPDSLVMARRFDRRGRPQGPAVPLAPASATPQTGLRVSAFQDRVLVMWTSAGALYGRLLEF